MQYNWIHVFSMLFESVGSEIFAMKAVINFLQATFGKSPISTMMRITQHMVTRPRCVTIALLPYIMI